MNGTLVLTASDVATLLTMQECIAAVENAFRLLGQGQAPPSHLLGVHVEGGGFHLKAGVLPLQKSFFAAKINSNFPENPRRFAIPTIQGVVALFDAENGFPLALMDSMEITRLRTAAATAVAAKYLARPDSRVLTLCGCGTQGFAQVQALCAVLPLQRVFTFDLDMSRSEQLAARIARELKLAAVAVKDMQPAAAESDVCVTCTPSRHWFLGRQHVPPGSFVAAVGADNELKQELEPELLAAGKVVVDSLEQCSAIGDLHHALQAGVMQRANVHAELGAVVAGTAPGRATAEEIITFDSTGMALQDAAAAAAVYEKARALPQTRLISLAA